MSRTHLTGCLTLLLGCSAANRQTVPDGEGEASAPPASETLSPELADILTKVTAAVRARDLALWAHWTQGVPLTRAADTAGLFTKMTLEKLRAARTANSPDARRLRNMEAFVAGEMLANKLEDEDVAIFNLEASLTFTFERREVPYRDLNRLLAGEKSEKRRKAMWEASLPAANRLDAMMRHRQRKLDEALADWGYTEESFLVLMRDEDLDTLAEGAERFLDLTSAAWRTALTRLARNKVSTTPDRLGRADFPALMRLPASEQRFQKNDILQKGLDVLKGLDLHNLPGLYLEPSDDPKKNALPLTIAPGGAADVRLSFRPLGGQRNQAALLLELGRALMLKHCNAGVEHCRLGQTLLGEVTGAVLASVIDEPAWLLEAQVAQADIDDIRFNTTAYQLFQARRAAGLYLFALSALEASDAESALMYQRTMSRAYGIGLTADDAARWRIESEPFLRTIEPLRTMAYARVLRAQLASQIGPLWWKSPKAGALFKQYWKQGTGVTAQTVLGPLRPAIDALAADFAAMLPAPVSSPTIPSPATN